MKVKMLAAVAAFCALVAVGLPPQAAVVLVLAAGAVLLCRRQKTTAYHSHGGHGTRTAARHEGGHVHAARKLGVSVRGAVIRPDGSGTTYCGRAKDPSHDIAISWAGQFAAGTASGCGGDQAYIRARLREVPRGERDRVAREGKVLGRRLGRSAPGRYAATLQRKGRL